MKRTKLEVKRSNTFNGGLDMSRLNSQLKLVAIPLIASPMLKKFMKVSLLVICLSSVLTPVMAKKKAANPVFKVNYEKFTLKNGLQVIFHLDRSDPVVAVSLTAHVGSAREKVGRTGFAHLFEHLLFLESENLGRGGLDKLNAKVGGSVANGATNRDRTNYYQTVPNDALEKLLWAEADKLGWFINTVTDPVLAKEKEVVKNEKRQRVDNAPYGHTFDVISNALYPQDHPYNWSVLGSLEDLERATLADVKEFFRRWYVPNNVTLVVAGDFDPVQAKRWVEKYFNEIKRGEEVKPLPKRPGVIKEAIKLYHEDNRATLPELTRDWPTVELYHPDSYPLAVLAQYLSKGKKAPFYQVLVDSKKLTDEVLMSNDTSELAGQFELTVRAFEDKDLDEVSKAIDEAFAKFEKEGISEKDLNRIKAGQETQFYNSLSSVLDKSFLLARYNIFANDPGFFDKDIKNILAVTPADVTRVYQKYIKNKPSVTTSFVPQTKPALALEGSTKAAVVEEKIVQGAEVDPNARVPYERTASTFDRSVEPPYGTPPDVKIPAIWENKLGNGLRVLGIQNTEVPLVRFEIVIDGGQLLEDINKVGVSNLMARLMMQGTQKRTPHELEEAIQQLGASIEVKAETESIRIKVNTLAKNYDATLALVEEILLEPRWDAKEFELAKKSTISQIQEQEAEPSDIAENSFNLLIYGKENIRSRNILGTIDSVNSITLDDLKAFYAKSISPSVARMNVVGSLDQAKITSPLKGIESKWKSKNVEIPQYKTPGPPAKSQVYFYDVPDAKQSVIRFGYPALAQTDRDFYPAMIMNYILGGGSFASRLTQELRESKGYTYNINSSFLGTHSPGPFRIASPGIRTDVTLEAAKLIKSIMENYPTTFSEKDLATTKGFLIKSNARAFETANAKLEMLDTIGKYGWKYDYVKGREQLVRSMTVQQIMNLSQKYLTTDKMIWLVVGDAKTQLQRMKELGFGEPILIQK